MNEIIAIRRNIGANGVFYRQRGLDVEYSLDKETWYHAFRLNSTTKTQKGDIDLLKDGERLIDKYSKKYYLDLDFKALINIDVTVNNRDDAIANPPERAFNPLRMCLALKIFLQTMRRIGLGIQNGTIEPDDVQRFGDTLLTNLYGHPEDYEGRTDMISLMYRASVAVFDLWTAVAFVWANVTGAWTDEQIEEYTCCLYEALESGEFNYSEFVNAGNVCGIGAWDEVATPAHYASIVSMVAYGELPTDKCPCEECLLYLPTDGNITRGVVVENTLITQNYTVSGSLIRMGSVVEFTIPNMVLTDVRILIGMTPYENLADAAVPRARLTAGGVTGFTDLPTGTNWVQLDPASYPLTPVSSFVLDINSSTCSACSTAQRAVYDQSFASLVFIIVCGLLQ